MNNSNNQEWLEALKEAVKLQGMKNISTLLGYSPTAIKLVIAGQYPHSTDNIKEAVRTKLIGYPENYIAVADTLKKLREGIVADKKPDVLLPLVNELEAQLLHPTPTDRKDYR